MKVTNEIRNEFEARLKEEISAIFCAGSTNDVVEIINIANNDNINREINKFYEITEVNKNIGIFVAFGSDSQKLVTIVEIIKNMIRGKNTEIYDATDSKANTNRAFRNKYEQFNKLYSIKMKKELPNESKLINKTEKRELLLRNLDDQYCPTIEMPVLVCLVKQIDNEHHHEIKLSLTAKGWSTQTI